MDFHPCEASDVIGTPAQSTTEPHKPRRKWWGLGLSAWLAIAGLIVAVVALIPDWSNFLAGSPAAAPSSSTVTRAGPSAQPTPSPDSGAAERSLFTLQLTRGVVRADRPDPLRSAPGLDGARYIDCPGNQTSKVTQVAYQLDEHYRGLSMTVSGWADGGATDQLLVKAYVTLPQRDGTTTKAYRGYASVAANGPPKDLDARIPGARELILELECVKPQHVLVLRRAAVTTE
jgi:hypothetical protein